ncbi:MULTISPECIES: hypothetical protein [unclassified Synechococcus]|uniref:hypothetical protein n=1 Tax=unclassified Synechococcus TaxID=2626047 RepID=UPI0039B0A89B
MAIVQVSLFYLAVKAGFDPLCCPMLESLFPSDVSNHRRLSPITMESFSLF